MSAGAKRRAARVNIKTLAVGTCACGKKSYATRGQAETAMHLVLALKGGPDPAPSSRALGVYRCTQTKSGQWHIGHRSPRCTPITTEVG
jgi:hypothetical protein